MTDNHRDLVHSALGHSLATGRMTRRDFMRRAAALGIGATAAATLAGTVAQAAGPTKGGSFKIAMGHGATSDTIDPALLFNGHQWALAYGFRNTLTQIGVGSVLEPCLATEWASDDARRWVFTLRRGVEFHGGKSLTGDDVVASINHHRAEDSKSAVKPIAEQIETIEKDGAHKIVITLTSANADFPFMLAGANFVICPANGEGGIDWQSGTGTGGYKLERYDPGVTAVLARNPNYWRDDRAHADDVELLTILDVAARTNALRSGAVDVIDKVDMKTVSRLKSVPGLVVEATQGPLHYLYSMLSDVAPFDDNNVRLALKHAVDRQELLDKILKGYGTIGNDHPIGPSYLYHDASLEQRQYDPDRAKYYLKQAGLGSLDIELSAADAAYAGAVDAAVLLAEKAAPAGINIKIVREPNDGYWSSVWMKKPFYTNYWGGYTTANEMLQTGYMPGAAWNDSHFDNEQFAKIFVQAKSELDTSKRREMFSDLQRILRDEGGQIIPLFPQDVLGRRERVAHGELAGDRGLDGRHIIERWWVTA